MAHMFDDEDFQRINEALKKQIAITLFAFENYHTTGKYPRSKEALEQDAIRCYQRDTTFYNKVNMLTHVVIDTLEKKDENT